MNDFDKTVVGWACPPWVLNKDITLNLVGKPTLQQKSFTENSRFQFYIAGGQAHPTANE